MRSWLIFYTLFSILIFNLFFMINEKWMKIYKINKVVLFWFNDFFYCDRINVVWNKDSIDFFMFII